MSRKAEAIMAVIEAKKVLDEAVSKCEYDRGYWLYREQEAYEKACQELEDAFSVERGNE